MVKLAEGKTINGCRFRYGKKQPNGFRAKIWDIKHSVNGKQINEGLGAITQKEATDIADELKSNKAANKRNSGKKHIQRLPETYAEMSETLDAKKREDDLALKADAKANEPFSDFFERFVVDREVGGRPHDEILKYRSRYTKWMEKLIGNKPARKIVTFDIQRIVKTMEKAGSAFSTITKVQQTIGQAYRHNVEKHSYTGHNPAKRNAVFEYRKDIKNHDNQRTRYLEPEEAIELLEALPEPTKAMATVSLMCGFRFGEIASLTWSQINFSTGTIKIPADKAKGRKARDVSFTQQVVDALPAKGKANELVFSRSGSPFKEAPKVFKTTVDRLGLNDGRDRLDRVSFHTLRHTCGTWLVDAGIDLFTVQQVLGHKHISTTQRYVHSTGKKKEAAAALGNILSSQTGQQEAVNE